LASRRPCAGLILEAPFTSGSDVAGTVLPILGPLLVRSLNSVPKIRSILTPKLFMQGDHDEIIPLRLGQELYAAAQESRNLFGWLRALGTMTSSRLPVRDMGSVWRHFTPASNRDLIKRRSSNGLGEPPILHW